MTEFNFNKSSNNLNDMLSIDEGDHNDYENVNTNNTMLLILNNVFSPKKYIPEEENFDPTLYFTKTPTMFDTKHIYDKDKRLNIIDSKIISNKKENNKIKHIFNCNIVSKDNPNPNDYVNFNPNSVDPSKIFRVDAAKKQQVSNNTIDMTVFFTL